MELQQQLEVLQSELQASANKLQQQEARVMDTESRLSECAIWSVVRSAGQVTMMLLPVTLLMPFPSSACGRYTGLLVPFRHTKLQPVMEVLKVTEQLAARAQSERVSKPCGAVHDTHCK